VSAGLRDVLALAAGGASARVVAARTGLAADLVDAMLDHAGRVGLVEAAGSRMTGTPVSPAPCSGCPATPRGTPAEEPRRVPLACAGCFFARR
jgi:hypothetical protein